MERGERRKHSRLDVRRLHVKAQVQVVSPEASFSPFVLDGELRDISPRGCGLDTVLPGSKEFGSLMRGPRLARVVCAFPTDTTPARLFGKILNFRIQGSRSDGVCQVGIDFGELAETDSQKLEHFLLWAVEEIEFFR